MSELRYLGFADVINSADPTWLIDQLLPSRGLVFLIGRFGAGKTFLALDWALHIATGRPWQGRATRTLSDWGVLYAYSEGFLKSRVQAWCTNQAIVPYKYPDMYFANGALNLLDPVSVERFLKFAKEDVRLVVLETLSSMTAGADENDSKTAGQAIEALHYIEKSLGATILVTHHTPLNPSNQRIRGHSRLGDGADTILLLENTKGALKLSTLKQREAESGDEIHLQLTPAHGSLIIEAGTAKPSADGEAMRAAAGQDECTVDELAKRLGWEPRTTRRCLLEAIKAGTMKHVGGTGSKKDPKRFMGE